MGRPSLARALDVWMNGSHVGTWRVPAHGADEFTYAPAWRASPLYRPLSLSLPAPSSNAPLRGALVVDYFDNLLPDNDAIRRRIQGRFHSASLAPFDLLAQVGRDCVGALQLVPEGEAPPPIGAIEGTPLEEAQVERELRRVVTTPGALGQRDGEEDELRISIAGAQEKTALLWHQGRWCRPHGATPSTHIFKLPLGLVGGRRLDLGHSVENEWLCLRLLAAFGLPVAQAHIATFGAQKCLIVERFDRRLADSGAYWLRLAQEDMCQATGTPGMRKYEVDGGPGMVDIAGLLRFSDDASDVERFLKTQVLFWMLRATDGHAKNFSITLKAGGRFSLTPAYDVISTWPLIGRGPNRLALQEVKMAMAWQGKNRHYRAEEILPRHFIDTARRCGYARMPRLLTELAAMTGPAIEQVRAQLPAAFPAQVAEAVFKGLAGAGEKLGVAVA